MLVRPNSRSNEAAQIQCHFTAQVVVHIEYRLACMQRIAGEIVVCLCVREVAFLSQQVVGSIASSWRWKWVVYLVARRYDAPENSCSNDVFVLILVIRCQQRAK